MQRNLDSYEVQRSGRLCPGHGIGGALRACGAGFDPKLPPISWCTFRVVDTDDDARQASIRRRAKVMLRQRARAVREAIPQQAIAHRSARIVSRLQDLDSFRTARSVALFWPMDGRNEVDLRALDTRARADNKAIYYPSVDIADGSMTFRRVDDVLHLEDRGLRIREPARTAVAAIALDLIVVPALGADLRGHRIGYGGGYHDKALPRFCPPAKAVIVVYAFELLAEVPDTEGDVAASTIVTEDRVIVAAEAGD